MQKQIIAGFSLVLVCGLAVAQSQIKMPAEKAPHKLTSEEAVTQKEKALNEALKRTNGDLPRALAYINGGESGLQAFDAKATKKPKQADKNVFWSDGR